MKKLYVLKQLCRDLYFKYRTTGEIIKETGVKKSTLSNWIHGRGQEDKQAWKFIREEERNSILSEYTDRRTHKIGRFQTTVIDFVDWSFLRRMDMKDEEGQPIPLEAEEARKWSSIMLDFNKLNQLFESKTTTIHEVQVHQHKRVLTSKDFQAAVQKDPFMRKLFQGVGNERPVELTTDADILELESAPVSGISRPDLRPETSERFDGDREEAEELN